MVAPNVSPATKCFCIAGMHRDRCRCRKNRPGRDTVPELHRLVAGIRHDEAHGCAVLDDAIRSLDATPTHATGALYEKAMAIDAPGSGWRS